ncbi:PepSY-associated TM helix domain-containing protein [Ilumatobacter sp.]|uniref:PepSY-associated TM helix domain-containing protein n=1 Tax=Ilumatobacter sp. TaxID=1967498 RepID=UPI003C6B4846
MTIDDITTAPLMDDPLLAVEPTPSTPLTQRSDGATRARRGKLGRDTHRWSRLIHVYTSMIALLVVLFFAATGITLNHPEWTFGDETETTVESGTFPFATQFVADDGSAVGVDYLSMAEYVREEYGVIGSVDSFGETNGEGSIAFLNPGYRADLSFAIDDGTFDLAVEQEGWVAVVNDLHKGRNTDGSWNWLIDISAGFLVVISLTGLVMQFFLKKRRTSAFVVAGAGTVITVVMVAVTLM